MGFTHPAAQILVAIIPIVAIVCAFVLCFFALLWRHHEAKLRIAKGAYSSFKFNFKAFSLLAGFCLTGVGLVLSFLFGAIDGISWSILGGLIPFILGIALLLFYKTNPEFKVHHKEFDPLDSIDAE